MGAGLFKDGAAQRVEQLRRIFPQHSAQVSGLAVAQAGFQLSGAGEPHPVAPGAEFVAHRVNDADAPGQALGGVVMRRAVAPVFRDGVQVGPDLPYDFQRGVPVRPRLGRPRADGHDLDEPHVQRAVLGIAGQRHKAGLAAGQQHTVQLGFQPRRQRRVNARVDLPQPVKAGDGREGFAVHRVQADVHPVQTQCGHLPRHGGQQQAVGGQCDLLHPGQRLEAAQKLHAAAAHQRLPAGDLEFRDAQRRGCRGHLQKFLVGQNVAVGKQRRAVRHTVAAAEIAAVGDGQPQIINGSSVSVLHHGT